MLQHHTSSVRGNAGLCDRAAWLRFVTVALEGLVGCVGRAGEARVSCGVAGSWGLAVRVVVEAVVLLTCFLNVG